MVNDTPTCSVVAACTATAVEQSAVDCSGCEDVATALGGELEKLRAERAHHEHAMELVKAELRRRADAGEDARLQAVEEVALRLGMDRVKELGAAIDQRAAAQAAVVDAHTHPVFACSKHKKQLPPLPASFFSADPVA